MSKTIKETNIVINNTKQLRDIILSGKFDNSIQVKNTEHICHDGTIYDYSSITDMSGLFLNCPTITTIPLLDTSNVTTMSFMFENCSSLTSIPLLNTSNVTNMSWLFAYCSNLKYIPPLDTSNVTNMHSMFQYCISLTSIPLFDISNIIDNDKIFSNCNLLTRKNLIEFIYQKDKLLLKSLETNHKLFPEDKLNELISKYV